MSGGYAVASQATIARPRGLTNIKRAKYTVEEKKPMKLTLKQRLRNWLLDGPDDPRPQDIYVEEDKLQSDGMRLQIYKANGGYVVETRGYDRKMDRNNYTMHIIKDDDDLGDALGKIVMMEALRG
jgi:hypothetical protein